VKRPERPAAQRTPVAKAPSPKPPPQREPSPKPPRQAAARSESASVTAKGARKAARIQQRYERAEVKRFTRRARRRRIGWLTILAILGLTAGLIAIAVFSPILALREIRVDGTSRLDPAVIREAVSEQLGTPLALIDDARIRDDLAQFTSIRSYVTELVPPGTLVIHIVERSPLGVLATPDGFEIVDAAGVVLESSPARPTGLPLLQLDEGTTDGAGFVAMTEVLIALPPEVLAQVDAISARTRDDVILILAGSDQRVVWGSADDSERKADILAALLARYAGAGPGEYDVSAPGSAVFRLD
jgi:cell division protein FtsQ